MLPQAQLPATPLTTSSDILNSVSAGTATSSASTNDPLMEKAQEFEAVFLNEMLQNMFVGLEDGGTYGTEEGSDAWKSMLINEYATIISESGGIGIASSVHSQLLALQENPA